MSCEYCDMQSWKSPKDMKKIVKYTSGETYRSTAFGDEAYTESIVAYLYRNQLKVEAAHGDWLYC